MDEGAKNKIIVVLICLTVLFIATTLQSCGKLGKLKSNCDKEIVTRLDVEEKMSKYSLDKANLEEQLKKNTQELDAEKAAHQATKKILLQEQLVGASLKEELEKTAKLKAGLEEELKTIEARQKSSDKTAKTKKLNMAI